nr:proline and serine-rich protein 2-like [Chrysemys picta bellii]
MEDGEGSREQRGGPGRGECFTFVQQPLEVVEDPAEVGEAAHQLLVVHQLHQVIGARLRLLLGFHFPNHIPIAQSPRAPAAQPNHGTGRPAGSGRGGGAPRGGRRFNQQQTNPPPPGPGCRKEETRSPPVPRLPAPPAGRRSPPGPPSSRAHTLSPAPLRGTAPACSPRRGRGSGSRCCCCCFPRSCRRRRLFSPGRCWCLCRRAAPGVLTTSLPLPVAGESQPRRRLLTSPQFAPEFALVQAALVAAAAAAAGEGAGHAGGGEGTRRGEGAGAGRPLVREQRRRHLAEPTRASLALSGLSGAGGAAPQGSADGNKERRSQEAAPRLSSPLHTHVKSYVRRTRRGSRYSPCARPRLAS